MKRGGRMVRRLSIGLLVWALVPALWLQAAPPGKDDKKADTVKPRIAVFRLHTTVSEEATEDLFGLNDAAVSLKDLVGRLKKAKDDPAVKAVVLLHESGSIGSAQTEEVRQVMAQ